MSQENRREEQDGSYAQEVKRIGDEKRRALFNEAWLILAHQWIAANLNVASGASVPDEIAAAGDGVALPDVSLVARAPGRVMLAFGGDAMMGRRYSDPFPGEPVLLRPGSRLDDARALLELDPRAVEPPPPAAER